MDATQMICDSILDSDEEDHEQENINDRGDPLGKLCILKNEHIPEKEFPLYLGDNMLGREPNTCSLSLLSPSVSKKHATISLSVYRRKGRESEVEALVWDLGSMNGTRKGHLKLTPNVRYALSEGDSLVVADIPCKYIKCTTDVPFTPKNTRTPVTKNLKEKLSDGLGENGSNLNTGRTSCLSFEQTPTQPQGTLVPDSESESDEEQSKIGDRRRKNIVSDSDSYKSSPTCSTFMSPTNKVIPESEDESPITPSSSYKNRTHRVVSLNEEIDININRQELKKRDALDSEEETGNEEAKAAFEDTHSKNEQPELSKSECDPSLTEGVKSALAIDAIPQFNMDSDTDVDEEEAVPVALNNAPASNAAHFHMDSDTDVDDGDTSAPLDPPPTSEATTKHYQTTSIPAVQPKGISMDSDTDVDDDDDDLLSTATAKLTEPPQTASTAEEAPKDFHLNSDTDVEEDSKEDGTPSRLDIKPDTSTTAAPQCLDVDSDTDDEGILGAAVSEQPVESAKPDLEIMSSSDTDVEDEGKPVTSRPTAAEAKLDSGEDTDVNESVGLPAAEGNPSDVTVDSDTDVEDKQTDFQEAGEKQISLLDREITPGTQTALLQNCSTPVQEGNIEEMDTQAFLSPSLSSFRRPMPPGRPVAFSPCVSQEEDDLVVAETQSFILNDRGQNTPPKDQSSGLDSSVHEKDGGDFQLELSDSSYCQAQALAMESTQAYVTVDPCLEETQPYADAITSDEKDLPLDIALQATQAYISEPFSDEEEDTAEDQLKEPALIEAAPCSPVPQSNPATIEEGGKQVDVHVAETQPMCIDEDDDSEESAPFFRKRKARQIEEEETQTLTNSDFSVAETQPMEIQEDRESEEDSPPVFRRRKAKQLCLEDEQTQPIEMPVNEQSDEEESTEISSKTNVEIHDEEEETQPCLDSELTVAQTQPIAVADIEESDEEDSVPVVTKSPKLQTQEEEKTLVNSELSVAATQPLGLSEDISSDEEEPIVAPRKRKAKPLEDTQSLTNAETDSQDTKASILKETEGPSEGETSNMNVRKTRGGGKLGKEKQEETEDVSVEPPTRRTKGRNKAVPVSRGRRGKAKLQHEDESEEEETQMSKKDHQETEEDAKEQIRQKKEEMARLEKERVEQEEKAAKIKKEMLEREKREREEKIQKERKKREEKERLEAIKRAEEELQRLKEQEKKLLLEMEEKQRLEKEKQAETKEEAPRRGRRTVRRTTAAPDSTLDDDDVPARRTRSRSNSSNSLSSERSVSSVTSQNSRGRGRGRGGRRSEVPVQKTPARTSNRRRTVAAETTIQTTEMSAPSPGSVSESNSEISSQGRGRGGRQRGRGRRAEPEPESVTVQNVQVTIEKALQRGRKSRKISPDDDNGKAVSQQSGSTRGQDRGKEELSKCTPDEEEDQAHNEEASTSTAVMQKVDISSKENTDERRRGRKRQTEAEAKNETETNDHAAVEEEQKDENPTVKRKAKNTPAKKSVKDLIDDDTKSEKPKSRERASIVQKKEKSEEEDDNDSADSNSMEQESKPKEQEVPQTPTVSRKRHSTIPESSPVVKTPRSCSASPSTVGRRASSQAYKVLFTGVVDEAGEKVLSRLRGSIAKDVTDMNCLVTDKVRRTVKFLCAVAKGVPIVTTQWLEKSGKAGTFLSPTAYIVKDREQEQKFNFSLQESLQIANSQPLLQGYEIHVTKSVRPEPVQMKDIITCSGALFLPKMPSSNKPQTLVISCEEDWSLCRPAVSSAVPILTAEFILTGILQQKLDFETHKLSGPVTAAQTAVERGRGRKK